MTGNQDGKVLVWNEQGMLQKQLGDSESEIISVTFSPDDLYSLATSKNGDCNLWDAQGNLLMNFPVSDNPKIPVTFSFKGQHIITVENDHKTIKTYPLPSVIFQQLVTQNIIKNADFQQFKQHYGIQFIGENETNSTIK